LPVFKGPAVPHGYPEGVTRTRRLSVVLILNLVLVAGLVVVGISANSLGVLAEGADYLADAAAIGVSLLAVRVSKLPPTPTRPRGYPMATTWAAGVNAGWLLVLSVAILAGAAGRLITGTSDVHGLPVLIVSGIAAVVMFVGALILDGDDGDDDGGDKAGADLNMRAVLLDTAGDAAAAAGVALAGAVIYVTQGLYWLDPVVAAIIALVVGYHAVRLLIEIFGALRAHRRSGSRP
jgi:cobalt-zinc-cadmium efflux system protein